MRLWSLHPKYLDAKGLTACWREGLLARKVLTGSTLGYRHHTQLIRFRVLPDPVGALDAYLSEVWAEAVRRGYRFDRSKIGIPAVEAVIPVTNGQLQYEREHLLRKLNLRDSGRHDRLWDIVGVESHPLFEVVEGDIEPWEKI